MVSSNIIPIIVTLEFDNIEKILKSVKRNLIYALFYKSHFSGFEKCHCFMAAGLLKETCLFLKR